jgi:hypothetical protein
VSLFLLGLSLAAIVPASASAAGQIASFKGERINLSTGWGKAKSCVEYLRGQATCYATHREADAVLGYSPANDPEAAAAALPACANGWLCLYEHIDGGGRRLIFNSEYWHNLVEWGFQCQTSSWRNRQSSG